MTDANDIMRGGGRLNPDDAVPIVLGESGPAEPAEPAIQGEEQGAEWEAPSPFARRDVPSFPPDIFPAWVERYVDALSTALQVPRDLPAMLVLAVAAASCAKCFRVAIAPGWTEPLNLYVAVAMPPASRKSPAFAAIAGPIREWERALRAREQERVRERGIVRRSLESRREKAEKKGDTDAALQAQRELDSKPPLALPRLLADDTTPEKLVSVMAENGGRMALLSPEGGVFGMMAGRYAKSGASDIDAVYLTGHTGEAIRVDRVTREGAEVDNPALTIGVTIQPSVIEGLAARPDFRGRGLLARFAWALPESRIGHRDPDPPAVPHEVERAYSAGFRAVLESLPLPSDSPPAIPFESAATPRRVAYGAEVEAGFLDPDGLLPIQDWGGKLVGLVCRIAGLLAVIESPRGPRVTLAVFDRAVRVGAFLQAHARAAFGLMGADPSVEGAKTILDWLRRKSVTHFSRRDCFNETRGERWRVVKEIEPALAALVDHGYIREEPPPPGQIGRPSLRYEVNPLWRK